MLQRLFVLDEDTTFSAGPEAGVLANDADAERRPLFAELVTLPLHGTLLLGADGALVYSPSQDFSGFDELTYRANDGAMTSNIALVTFIANGTDNVCRRWSDPDDPGGRRSARQRPRDRSGRTVDSRDRDARERWLRVPRGGREPHLPSTGDLRRRGGLQLPGE
ncbi:MAG: Ig-like domain-containing protein [Deltaproteobacteria bacterium]|nr:Ig-like domain-containing protein [Deltaproteobacteria bacterium]